MRYSEKPSSSKGARHGVPRHGEPETSKEKTRPSTSGREEISFDDGTFDYTENVAKKAARRYETAARAASPAEKTDAFSDDDFDNFDDARAFVPRQNRAAASSFGTSSAARGKSAERQPAEKASGGVSRTAQQTPSKSVQSAKKPAERSASYSMASIDALLEELGLMDEFNEISADDAEKTRKEQEDKDRLAQEKAEAERAEKARREKERAEKERLEKERLEKARLEREQARQERAERERRQKEQEEQDRLAQEKAEAERAEKARREKERAEKERLEKERLEKARLEKERMRQERAEKERLEKEKAAQQKREREDAARTEREKIAAEREALRREREQLDREKAELRRKAKEEKKREASAREKAREDKNIQKADEKKAAKAKKRSSEPDEESGRFLIGNFIATFLLTVFVIVAVSLVVLKVLGINVYYVASGSMEPAYKINSIVFSKEVEPGTIKAGDTITYALNDDTYVTHRVVSVNTAEHTFTTKGDANNVVDAAPVLWDNVMGKVVFALPFGGQILKVIVAPENRVTFIVIIAVLLLGTLVWDVVERIIKKRRAKKE